jgi:hypothetical protein
MNRLSVAAKVIGVLWFDCPGQGMNLAILNCYGRSGSSPQWKILRQKATGYAHAAIPITCDSRTRDIQRKICVRNLRSSPEHICKLAASTKTFSDDALVILRSWTIEQLNPWRRLLDASKDGSATRNIL